MINMYAQFQPLIYGGNTLPQRLLALLLCAAGLVGVEFALDKSGLPAFVGYGAMVVLLALIAAAECGTGKRVK